LATLLGLSETQVSTTADVYDVAGGVGVFELDCFRGVPALLVAPGTREALEAAIGSWEEDFRQSRMLE